MNAPPFVAVVTGASSGIGEATARRLAREPGARLVLVARREERLRALAESLGVPAGFVAVDLTADGAPDEVLRARARTRHGRLDLLVNNAGAGWRATLRGRRPREREPDDGAELRRPGAPHRGAPAPAPRVRAELDRERVERVRAAWRAPGRAPTRPASSRWPAGPSRSTSRSAANGVHVGLVLPGFIATEGFPAGELKARLPTRWMVSRPERVADAIVDAGPGGRPERYVPRPVRLAILTPRADPGPVPARDVGRRRGGDDHARATRLETTPGRATWRAEAGGARASLLRAAPHCTRLALLAPTPAGSSASR